MLWYGYFCPQAAHKCVVAIAVGCAWLLLFMERCWSNSGLKLRTISTLHRSHFAFAASLSTLVQ